MAAMPGVIAPETAAGISGHSASVNSVEMNALNCQLEQLSAWALDVRRLQSGRERSSIPHRRPVAPSTAASPRPSVRACKFAAALHDLHRTREQRQAQAATAAMQRPVEEASRQICDRIARLENALVPKPPPWEPRPQAQVSPLPEAVVSQRRDVELLDRSDLGENDFQQVFVSSKTAIFRDFSAVAGAAHVVAKMKRNHEATKPDRSKSCPAVGQVPHKCVSQPLARALRAC